MKPAVLREMKSDELVEKLEMEQEGLSKLRMNHSVSQLENPMLLRTKKREVAQLKTEIRRRELAKS